MAINRVLVTGATGYVGGRLIPKLLEQGFQVRAMGRSLEKLKSRLWANSENLELVAGDVLDKDALRAASDGCSAVYYLVHSMLPGQKNFQMADRDAAENMRSVAEEVEMERIIYLSGLGEDDPSLSKHLKSRTEVAEILQKGKVPVTVLRAAMVIGSGSASFEILRYLVDRLPVMITPRWLETPSQPIAIRNVIEYLVGCLNQPETIGQTFDIGGSEIVTYRKLMEAYAEEAKLPSRFVMPVPVLTPRLSSYWIHLITPVPAAIARPLAEGLRNPVVCTESKIKELIPQDLLSPREAIAAALRSTETGNIKSHWTDAGRTPPVEAVYVGDPQWSGGTQFKDQQERNVAAPAKMVWYMIQTIGGRRGWYHANWLWVLRGFLDRLVGGVGLRRGRRDDLEILSGDALDFWRVLTVDPQKQLLLFAEMKLPGRATLEFRIEADSEEKCRLIQTALFSPRGLFGILYWYLVLPFHGYIFKGMIRNIAQQAEQAWQLRHEKGLPRHENTDTKLSQEDNRRANTRSV